MMALLKRYWPGLAVGLAVGAILMTGLTWRMQRDRAYVERDAATAAAARSAADLAAAQAVITDVRTRAVTVQNLCNEEIKSDGRVLADMAEHLPAGAVRDAWDRELLLRRCKAAGLPPSCRADQLPAPGGGPR